MQKITLPFVMIATLSVLVSCGADSTNTSVRSLTPSPLTGSVVTTSATPAPVSPTPTVTGIVVTPAPVQPTAPAPVPTPTVNPVKPEVFTRTVSYKTPAGNDPVEFSVTVTDGVIIAVSTTVKAENDISKIRQTKFAAEVSTKVVGKKIKDLNLDAIGGSSLTTAAFEQFIQTI